MKKNPHARSLTFCAALLAASCWAQAYTLDLSAAGAYGTINNATYTQTPEQSAGTGVINSFVRVGAANQDVVQAYNTTANTSFDNVGGDTFNHAITVGDVGFQPLGSNSVMRFFLDINQTNASPLLNLDEVQIFLSTTPNQSTTSFSSGLLALSNAALVYRLDAGGDNQVLLDYSLNSGSGSGDMTLDLLSTAFDSAFAALGLSTDAQKSGAYIYLYSKFGSAPHVNNDGFEEWSYRRGLVGATVPEPSSLALIALGLLGITRFLRRRA